MSKVDAMSAAIDAEVTRRSVGGDLGSRRDEYNRLLMENNPSKAAQLIDAGASLGRSPDAVKGDLANVQQFLSTYEKVPGGAEAAQRQLLSPANSGLSQGEADFANAQGKVSYGGMNGWASEEMPGRR